MKKNENGAILTLLLIIVIAFFAIGFYITNKVEDESVPDNVRKNIESTMVKIGYDKNKIIRIMPDSNWQNGPRYKIDYDNELYFVYAYENGEIQSINDSKMNKIYENTTATGIDASNVKNTDIVLIEGQLGQYGKEDDFGASKHIRYYLPAGTYNVKALVRGTQFFIEKVKITKNSSGYGESEMVRNISLSSEGSTETITLKDDECILLTINSKVSLEKK